MIKNTYHLYKPIQPQQKYPITDISRQIDVKWLGIYYFWNSLMYNNCRWYTWNVFKVTSMYHNMQFEKPAVWVSPSFHILL